MNTSGHLPVSETAAKRVRKRRAPISSARKTNGRRPKKAVNSRSELPSAGTLARTKTLLLAALRVWELKHRVTGDY